MDFRKSWLSTESCVYERQPDDDDKNDDDEHGAQFFFQNLVRVDAVDLIKKSSKSELSSQFFGRLQILPDWTFLCGANTEPKNTTLLETMASWALKNPARKMTDFKGYGQYVWS